MRAWTALLPLALVRWIALRHGERIDVREHARTAVLGPGGVLFVVPEPEPCCYGISSPAACTRVRCQLGKRCAGPLFARDDCTHG